MVNIFHEGFRVRLYFLNICLLLNSGFKLIDYFECDSGKRVR